MYNWIITHTSRVNVEEMGCFTVEAEDVKTALDHGFNNCPEGESLISIVRTFPVLEDQPMQA